MHGCVLLSKFQIQKMDNITKDNEQCYSKIDEHNAICERQANRGRAEEVDYEEQDSK